MPAKYHHVKKRSASGLASVNKKSDKDKTPTGTGTSNANGGLHITKPSSSSHHSHSHHNHSHHSHNHGHPNPLTDRPLNLPPIPPDHALLSRTISRILLLRYEHDIARLYSTRLYALSLVQIPSLTLRIAGVAGTSWAAWNCGEEGWELSGMKTPTSEDAPYQFGEEYEDRGKESIKDFFRAVIGMDMREAGERVATKSVLWSYTALRHFALSNNVTLCPRTGLHSHALLPFLPQLQAHLAVLESMPKPRFEKPRYMFGSGFSTQTIKGMKGTYDGNGHYEFTTKEQGILDGIGELMDAMTMSVGASGRMGGFLGGGATGSARTMIDSVKEGVVKAWGVKHGLGKPKKKPKTAEDGGGGGGEGEQDEPLLPPYAEPLMASFDALVSLLWDVANEFSPAGYGLILREKLLDKWCECGCSTDHLGEVCERTVREEEEWERNRLNAASGEKGKGKRIEGGHGTEGPTKRQGKQREWDGRGSGVYGWDTEEEEDIWDVELDFGGGPPPPVGLHSDRGRGGKRGTTAAGKGRGNAKKAVKGDEPLDEDEMTIGEMMEWRYLRAEKEKEAGNAAYRRGEYEEAVKLYEKAYEIEPEVPHYQLNLAAAHLKLNNWIEAEKACTNALAQHPLNVKGLFRRGKARSMMYADAMQATGGAANGKSTKSNTSNLNAKKKRDREREREAMAKRDGAIEDLRAALRVQPTNEDAIRELSDLLFPDSNGAAAPTMTSTTGSLDVLEEEEEIMDERSRTENAAAAGSSSGSGGSGSNGSGNWSLGAGSSSGSGSSSGWGGLGPSSSRQQTPIATKDPPYHSSGGSSSSTSSGSMSGSGSGSSFASPTSYSSSGSGPSSGSGSGGSSSATNHSAQPKESAHTVLLRKLGVLPPVSATPSTDIPEAPFAKTEADEQKLRIVLLPPSKSSATNGSGSGNGAKGTGVLKVNMNGIQDGKRKITVEFSTGANSGKAGDGNGNEKKTKKNKSQEEKERLDEEEERRRLKVEAELERMKGECASYPSWERYMVKKV
ncbi:hypothetical protein CPC08DRAFT_764806 [Agrocybe pediades]|nr:hypothetical protein CPC08DRAFT_764806 [Agrocybe pediades]